MRGTMAQGWTDTGQTHSPFRDGDAVTNRRPGRPAEHALLRRDATREGNRRGRPWGLAYPWPRTRLGAGEGKARPRVESRQGWAGWAPG